MAMEIFERLESRRTVVGVLGLGYVGMPLALEMAKHFDVVGYDPSARVIASKPTNSPPPSASPPPPDHERERAEEHGCFPTIASDISELADASFYIIAVGTPVDSSHKPDIGQLLSATESVGAILKRGDYVVYESTVFPGCTEEECIPLLERISGLRCGRDFKVGYSPERINPGDASHELVNTPKIISGCDDEAAAEIARVYGRVIAASLHIASDIRSAEAAKLLENIQRCVNIALMNEMSMTLGSMGIDMDEVVALASSKWNFTAYSPGLVGGHCIPVDPYYLISEASRRGGDMPLTRMSCAVNERMPAYVADEVARRIGVAGDVAGRRRRVLVMGVAYKSNSDDIRNSGVVEMAERLSALGVECDVVDEVVDGGAVKRMYGLELSECPSGVYDAVVIAVAHDCYAGFDEEWFGRVASGPEALLADLWGIYKGRISNMKYWTL